MGFENQHPVSEDRKKYTDNEARLAEIKNANIGDLEIEDIMKMKEDQKRILQENQDLHGKAFDEATTEEGERENAKMQEVAEKEQGEKEMQDKEQALVDAKEKFAQNSARLAELKDMKVEDLEMDKIIELKTEQKNLENENSKLKELAYDAGYVENEKINTLQEDEKMQKEKDNERIAILLEQIRNGSMDKDSISPEEKERFLEKAKADLTDLFAKVLQACETYPKQRQKLIEEGNFVWKFAKTLKDESEPIFQDLYSVFEYSNHMRTEGEFRGKIEAVKAKALELPADIQEKFNARLAAEDAVKAMGLLDSLLISAGGFLRSEKSFPDHAFQRIYKEIGGEIKIFAEKIVKRGLGNDLSLSVNDLITEQYNKKPDDVVNRNNVDVLKNEFRFLRG